MEVANPQPNARRKPPSTSQEHRSWAAQTGSERCSVDFQFGGGRREALTKKPFVKDLRRIKIKPK